MQYFIAIKSAKQLWQHNDTAPTPSAFDLFLRTHLFPFSIHRSFPHANYNAYVSRVVHSVGNDIIDYKINRVTCQVNSVPVAYEASDLKVLMELFSLCNKGSFRINKYMTCQLNFIDME